MRVYMYRYIRICNIHIYRHIHLNKIHVCIYIYMHMYIHTYTSRDIYIRVYMCRYIIYINKGRGSMLTDSGSTFPGHLTDPKSPGAPADGVLGNP